MMAVVLDAVVDGGPAAPKTGAGIAGFAGAPILPRLPRRVGDKEKR